MKQYHTYIFGGICIALSAILTITCVTGLQELFPGRSQPLLRGGWIVVGLTMWLCIHRWISKDPHAQQPALINTVFIIMLGELLYTAFLLLGDLWQWVTNGSSIGLNITGCILAGCFLLAAWHGSTWGKYRYTVLQETIEFPDLPEAFDGIKIVQISDIHAGSFDNVEMVTRGIDLIKQQTPDIFVFTGDLVNNTAEEFDAWKEIFSGISAPLGQYSILGNHDYGDYHLRDSPHKKIQNLDTLKQHHADIGRRLLLNEHLVIDKDGQSLVIAGVENRGDGFARYGDLQKTLEGVDDAHFTIMLSHDPSHWDKQILHHPKQIHLTLAGHTHAMQMGLSIGKRKRSPIKYRYARRAGLYKEAAQYLYVNKGFGFLGLRARIGMRPEITVLTLKKKK